MLFMAEWDIKTAARQFQHHPVLGNATQFLKAFMEETNAHSDGWAYWPLPSRAAKNLMQLIEAGRRNEEVTDAAFRKAVRPIKSFYTRRGYAAGMKFPDGYGV